MRKNLLRFYLEISYINSADTPKILVTFYVTEIFWPKLTIIYHPHKQLKSPQSCTNQHLIWNFDTVHTIFHKDLLLQH